MMIIMILYEEEKEERECVWDIRPLAPYNIISTEQVGPNVRLRLVSVLVGITLEYLE